MEEQHPEARLIIDTLKKNGYIAYYAGGWVRDFLLDHPSDDIDIATNASPEKVQELFKKTVPIGLAFGIILVLIETKQFEVATFRLDLEYKDGRRPSKIEFTDAKEDALRRDFTINGMFYDPAEEKVIDYVEGQKDLEKKVIRAIGDAHERIREDRLRMIRAIRFACRFHFTLEEKTEKAILAHAKELFPAVAIERVVQEFSKIVAFPNPEKALLQLFDFNLLTQIFPRLSDVKREDLQKNLNCLQDFPQNIPTIAYLMELFPNDSLKQKEELCTALKISNQDLQFVLFLHKAKILIQKKDAEDLEWAYFFAHPSSRKCIGILTAHVDIHDRPSFIERLEKKKGELLNFIQRIEEKKPVVGSSHLLKIGIQPGKKMGDLLAKAERIAINEKIEDPEKILSLLMLDGKSEK